MWPPSSGSSGSRLSSASERLMSASTERYDAQPSLDGVCGGARTIPTGLEIWLRSLVWKMPPSALDRVAVDEPVRSSPTPRPRARAGSGQRSSGKPSR